MTKLLPLLILLPIVAAAYVLTRPAPEPCQRHAWYGPMGDGDQLTCRDDAGAEGDAVARGDGGR